ncbi:MAG: glyoxalase/bleomycin resistance/dioxygenase family protein [Verrucomicrobiota bacterium]
MMNRRQALKAGSVLGAGLVASNAARADEVGQGIAEIRMKSVRLDDLRRFYEEQLGLSVSMDGDNITIEAGTTRLIFSPSEASEEEPFYHYAFNIPENKIETALQWQKERTPLLRRGNKELIHFKDINAHSVYFNDPAGNIVEYIARHDLDNAAKGGFGPKDILYASEIGLVVDDVAQTQSDIKDSLGLTGFPGSYRSHSFSPVGDAHALLILVKRDRKWFPNQKQAAKVHPVEAMIRGAGERQLRDADLKFQVDLISAD